MSDPRGTTPACYLHPDRPALLRCSRCERPICADDAIEAPVGYQCRECAKGAAPVRDLRSLLPEAQVTKVLVGAIAVVFVLTSLDGANQLLETFGLWPVGVGQGEWWRLVTSGFLHANLVHLGFNALLLWQLGQMLEPALGHARFTALYTAGLAGGSLGVVLLSWVTVVTPLASIPLLGPAIATSPVGLTVGASGAVFALMGAAMAGMRERGINPWQTSIGSLVALNLVLTFAIPGISVGGHVGGLLAGVLAGRLLLVPREQQRRATLITAAAAVGMLVLAGLLARATLRTLLGG